MLAVKPNGRFKRPVGRPRRDVAPEHVRELRRQGLSFRRIAEITGCSYGTVRRVYVSAVTGTSR